MEVRAKSFESKQAPSNPMTLLSNIVSESRPWHPLLLVQSSAAQSGLPILRKIVESSEHTTLLFCLLYLPSNFVEKTASQGGKTEVFNYLGNVPGYNNSYSDLREDISTAVRSGKRPPSCRPDRKLISP